MKLLKVDTVVKIEREGAISDYVPEDANLYGFIKEVDASLENPYYVVFDGGTRSMNLNSNHFYTPSEKASDTEYGLCVCCLNYDEELVEADGVYGVGKCCSEEQE